MPRKRILVTGGAGFLGSHLCELLLSYGHEVLCVDNYFTGTKQNVAACLDNPHFELIRHDVTFPLYVEVDEIYNLSGQSSVAASFRHPLETFDSITVATMNLLECLRLLGRPVRIDLAGIEAKLVRGGRGGYCFEQNRLLAAALGALGVASLGVGIGYGLSTRAHAAPPHVALAPLVTVCGGGVGVSGSF